MLGRERAHLIVDLRALTLRKRGDEGRRLDAVHQPLDGHRFRMLHHLIRDWGERRAFVERALPRAVPEPRDLDAALTLVGKDYGGDARDPVDALVANVPHDAQPAVRPKNAMDLRQSFVVLEPVERLGDDDGGNRMVFERHLFGRPVDRAHVRQRGNQLRAHTFDRLDRDDVETPRDQCARHLPRPGGKVDHGIRTGVQTIDQPMDRRVRIAGPRALVHVGGSVEPDRRRPVNVAQRSTQETCLSSVNSSMP